MHLDDETMIEHLQRSGLAGVVGTTVANTRSKIEGLYQGDPRCTFGLSLAAEASEGVVLQSLLRAAGETLADPEGRGHIDPMLTLAGMKAHAAALRPVLEDGGRTVLIATGHPSGLIEHYLSIARALEATGNVLLRPLDGGGSIHTGMEFEPESSIRFVGSVGCVYRKPGTLAHSHLPDYMHAMLDELAGAGTVVDLVIGDHGMAGAAIQRRIPTISIADVNDLPLLIVDDADQALLVIDDNLPSRNFRVVTEYILERAARHAD